MVDSSTLLLNALTVQLCNIANKYRGPSKVTYSDSAWITTDVLALARLNKKPPIGSLYQELFGAYRDGLYE